MTRRLAALLLALAIMTAALPPALADGRPVLAVTGFAAYDWLASVLGERAAAFDLVLPGDSGADLHSFQPSANDMVTLMTADLLVYNGGASDQWLAEPVADRTRAGRRSLSLMGELSRLVQRQAPGPGQASLLPDPCAALDEHIWLSLRNAQALVTVLAGAMADMDPDHGDTYRRNAQAYAARLQALDAAYQAVAERADGTPLLMADRFPFRYLMHDYQIPYFAAFEGCSTESVASFETVAFLAGKVNELRLRHVLILEDSSERLAHTVISAAGVRTATMLRLNAMQAVSRRQRQAGASYLGIMADNLDVLADALGVHQDQRP